MAGRCAEAPQSAMSSSCTPQSVQPAPAQEECMHGFLLALTQAVVYVDLADLGPAHKRRAH